MSGYQELASYTQKLVTVGPNVDVTFALVPGLLFVPPRGFQPRGGRGRQALGILTRESRQRLDRLRLAQVGRNQRRAELDLVAI